MLDSFVILVLEILLLRRIMYRTFHRLKVEPDESHNEIETNQSYVITGERAQ